MSIDIFYHLGHSILSEIKFSTNYFFQGVNLLELASHLERKAAHLCLEGLGKIKVALTSSNTSPLLEILEGAFGLTDLDTSDTTSSVSANISTQEPTDTEKSTEEKPPEKVPIVSSGESSLATAELVFPLKSISPVISGIPKLLLLLHGPRTFFCYKCQHPSCNQEFLQKVVAYNHVCHCDDLHVALACLYCSADNSPKMHWYSTSAWEHHIHKHVQDNLPIHPDDPTFYQQFSKAETLPSTSKLASTIPQTTNIQERAKMAKQFIEE